MPWITEELRGLKVWLAVDTAMKSRVWQYAQQMLLWWWLVSVFTNPALILPLILAGIVLTPKNIIKTLQAVGKWQERVSWVINKIKWWNKLSTIEEARVWSLLKSKQDELSTLKDSLDLDTKPTNVSTKNNMSNMVSSDDIMKQPKPFNESQIKVSSWPKPKTTKANKKWLPKNEWLAWLGKTMDAKTPQLKATVKATDEALYKEARKYKSAEEFIESKIDDYVNWQRINHNSSKSERKQTNKI